MEAVTFQILKKASKMSIEQPINGTGQKDDDEEDELERIRMKRIEQMRRIASRRIVEIPVR